jgi:hypothetical protein
VSPDEEVLAVLRELQFVLLKHPVAAQAALRALVAEGRRFACTEEGRVWKERLAGSPLVRRGQTLWDGSAFDLFDPREDAVLPSAYVDAVLSALTDGDLQALLLRLTYAGHTKPTNPDDT